MLSLCHCIWFRRCQRKKWDRQKHHKVRMCKLFPSPPHRGSCPKIPMLFGSRQQHCIRGNHSDNHSGPDAAGPWGSACAGLTSNHCTGSICPAGASLLLFECPRNALMGMETEILCSVNLVGQLHAQSKCMLCRCDHFRVVSTGWCSIQ